MAVLFDTSILLLAIYPNALPSDDPVTGKPVEQAKKRDDCLIRKLIKTHTKIIIPAPVLSELLVHAGSAKNEYTQRFQEAPFRIAPFDTRAAIECADAIRIHGLKKGTKNQDSTRAKVKFDRQIIAIAQVEQVEEIYSDDSDIYRYGAQAGIKVTRLYELDLDPDDRQQNLNI